MPKAVQLSQSCIYLIGGSSDTSGNVPVNSVLQIDPTAEAITPVQKTPMNYEKMGFGTCISQDRKRIYVCGGIGGGKKFVKTCEYYDIEADSWRPLPELLSESSSVSLCEFSTIEGQKWLFAFGGVEKRPETGENHITDAVYRLDLSKESDLAWETLDVKMTHGGLDISSVQISHTQILLSGGWNKSLIDTCCLLELKDGHWTATTNDTLKLMKSDFWMGGETVVQHDDGKISLFGNHGVHRFDLKSHTFEHVPFSETKA